MQTILMIYPCDEKTLLASYFSANGGLVLTEFSASLARPRYHKPLLRVLQGGLKDEAPADKSTENKDIILQ